ncbi:MAG: nuclear transport factor 2 family protein [Solirubrobacterales bacterium]
MSQENVEIVRAFIDAFNRGDMDATFKDAAPDVEYDLSRAVGPFHGAYRGLDEVRRVVEEFAEPWESNRYEIEEFIEVGEHVVTPFKNYLRGRDGIEVQARAAWVWTIHGGTITHVIFYQDRRQALEAAGLSE